MAEPSTFDRRSKRRLMMEWAMSSVMRSARTASWPRVQVEECSREALRFLNRAGRLLSSSLDLDQTLQRVVRLAVPRVACFAMIDLKREDVYIANVIKCRPPNNRTPERGEAKACSREFLWPEVRAVKPEFMLLLGASASRPIAGPLPLL